VTDDARAPRLLQQFARYPRQGRVKTRLARSLGVKEACRVHETLLERSARTLLGARLGAVELWLDEVSAHPLIDDLVAAGMQGPRQQAGADLGDRMAHALASGLRRAQRVVLVGSDCPGLNARYLRDAFAALESSDLVFGPAEDGGYVLVGCRSIDARLFSGIRWGSAQVLEQSMAQAKALGRKVDLLEALYDVDESEDLERWRNEVGL
jgi:rSAM/selenodomain-associated transferase 1